MSLTLASARDVNRDNKALLRATSPFEDLVEFGLTKNEAAISKSLTEADRRAAVIREVIGSSASGKFDELLAALHQATTDRDHSRLAMSAVEAFRLLIDNLKPQGLQVPKEVSLLDYAGFKLQVLGAAALLANIWSGLGAATVNHLEPNRHHLNVVDGLCDPTHPLTRALFG